MEANHGAEKQHDFVELGVAPCDQSTFVSVPLGIEMRRVQPASRTLLLWTFVTGLSPHFFTDARKSSQ